MVLFLYNVYSILHCKNGVYLCIYDLLTFCCLCDRLMDPWNVYMYVCMYVHACVYACVCMYE